MKIITLCLATVFAGLAAVPALAAEGKLNFIGKVVNASCKLEGVSDSGVIDVSMGAIPLKIACWRSTAAVSRPAR